MSTVAQIVQHLRPGGIECLALELLRNPPGSGNGLLISLEGDADTAIREWPRLAAHRDRLVFLGKRPGADLGLVFRLARVLRQHGVDRVHTHHVGPMIYGGAAARLARIRRLVHTEHDAWHLQERKRARLVRRVWSLLLPRLVADAQLVADQVRELARIPVAAIVRNGVDLDRFSPGDRMAARSALGLPAHVELIGVAGRLAAVKNQSAALKALTRLPAGSIHLAFAGDGEERAALEAEAEALGIRHRVHFLGHLDGIERFYRAVDVICLPSRFEGYPLSLIEAQACGTPVVATNVGGVAEAVCPVSGRLVADGDIVALAAALDQVLWSSRRCAARTFAERHGSLDTMVSGYAAVMA
ncbi:MAG: glycosyltransferase [Minwuia sp.]|uniref:glycosyltransferase n=1 Tax=Minwuia sp. TaxID=2493630 RepID=UPI003A839A30